jgi:hypothetical protein
MTNYDKKKPVAVESCGGGSIPAPRFRKSAAVVGGSSCPTVSPLDFRGGGIGFAMLCRLKTRGEGSRGPAGGGVVGGEGLRVFQYWYRPSYFGYQVPARKNQLVLIATATLPCW